MEAGLHIHRLYIWVVLNVARLLVDFTAFQVLKWEFSRLCNEDFSFIAIFKKYFLRERGTFYRMEILRMRLNNQPSLFRKWDLVALTDDYCSKALGFSWSRDRLIYKHLRTLLMNLFWSGLDQVTVLIRSSKKNLQVQTSACGPEVWSFGVIWVQPVNDQLTFVPKTQGFWLEHARDLGRKT